tara:strand:+ start:18320 stop:18598 length:279 start_codon:yes stop_codon:yes gene_type:complete
MQTVYDANGNPTKLDSVDANQRIAAGIAFAHNPLTTEIEVAGDAPESVEPQGTEKDAVMAELDGMGVEYNSRSKMKTLQALLDEKKAELDAE